MEDDKFDSLENDDPSHWMPIQHSLPSSPTPFQSLQSLFQAHQSLLQNQPNMDKRTFNKNVLNLFHQTMSALQQYVNANPTPPPILPIRPPDNQWDHLKEALGEFRTLLLNSKEMASEELVERVVQYISQTLSPLLTADERREELQKKCLAFVHDLSPQLSLKVGPLIKSCIARQFGVGIEDMLAEVRLPEMSLKDKTQMYTRMLHSFLGDSGSISFACSNRQLLGNLLPVDLWFLTFFAFVTAKRCRGDNLLMLGCVGKSSVGKSLLFESVILTTGHQIISSTSSHSGDAGVGRFNTYSKNTVIFHPYF